MLHKEEIVCLIAMVEREVCLIAMVEREITKPGERRDTEALHHLHIKLTAMLSTAPSMATLS